LHDVETPGFEGNSCFDIRSLATEVYSTSVEVTTRGHNTAITKTITWYRANHSTSDGEKLLVRQIADFTERANANTNPH
jgi:hypothetical protein